MNLTQRIHTAARRVMLLLAMACGQMAVAQTQHTVEPGETLYRISRTYCLTVAELEQANPGLTADNLKAGSIIRIPSAVSMPDPPQARVNVALVLPFSAKGLEGGRSIEFYRGFLLAAEQLAGQGSDINFHAYDERVGEALAVPLQLISVGGVQVMVGPVYPEHFQEMANFARANKVRMVVPFYSKADQVNTNPYVYLANTPEKFELEFVADLFLRNFKGMNVAFMRLGGGNENNFTQYLRKRLMARGYAVTEFAYDAPLEQMKTACNASRNTIVIPDASNEAGLAKALAKVEGFRKYYPQYGIQLFGYPDWLDFADKYKERMHAADTYVYTGNFYNKHDAATRAFVSAYTARYGDQLQEVSPRMGLLGYDLAMHLIQGIARYGTAFSTQASGAPMLQSNLRFERTEEDGGLVNNSMFFIHYKPDGTVDKLAAAHK
ncbi:MAG: ABC transporter substrate-binding protein [Alloprevotella sp.]|nr:ABC transporter substrate-binding protein [Alloprevotella sp.]